MLHLFALGEPLAVPVDELPHGKWQLSHSDDRCEFFGDMFADAKMLDFWRPSPALKAMANAAPADRDVYQFGVYTGGSMKVIAQKLPHFRKMWGFDSFRGLPEEAKKDGQNDLKLEGRHWLPGAFSAADALGVYSLSALMDNVSRHVDDSRVHLVPGFFSESLPRMALHKLRKAALVDIDGDLYVSAIQSLTWLFQSCLVEAGTVIRYDDWGVKQVPPSWGEQLAHAEITQTFRVRWSKQGRLGSNEFRVVNFTSSCEPIDATQFPWVDTNGRLSDASTMRPETSSAAGDRSGCCRATAAWKRVHNVTDDGRCPISVTEVECLTSFSGACRWHRPRPEVRERIRMMKRR